VSNDGSCLAQMGWRAWPGGGRSMDGVRLVPARAASRCDPPAAISPIWPALVHRSAGARRISRQAASQTVRLAENRPYPGSSTVASPTVRPPICSGLGTI